MAILKISWIICLLLANFHGNVIGNVNTQVKVFKILSDDFGIQIGYSSCTGQTICLCYVTDDKIAEYKEERIGNLCDETNEAFICAKHAMDIGNDTHQQTILLTSAMTDPFIGPSMPVTKDYTFDVSVTQKRAKVEGKMLEISSFKYFQNRGIKQSAIKLYKSSCNGEGSVLARNLQEVDTNVSEANQSLWEMVISYMQEAEMKTLEIVYMLVQLIAGLFGIQINPSNVPNTTTVLPPTTSTSVIPTSPTIISTDSTTLHSTKTSSTFSTIETSSKTTPFSPVPDKSTTTPFYPLPSDESTTNPSSVEPTNPTTSSQSPTSSSGQTTTEYHSSSTKFPVPPSPEMTTTPETPTEEPTYVIFTEATYILPSTTTPQ